MHHLFYNYTNDIFTPMFIEDSYSCIKGRGTHYGIERLKHHIRSESRNYSRSCYVLKLDIVGYFMHINRGILLRKSRELLSKNEPEYKDFVDYLLENIALIDPVKNCIIVGDKREWQKLPDNKSLFKAEENCGLPIGNLSSQLFSNIYMNSFDHFCKRELKCKHYGRYVDDIYIVGSDKEWLKSLIEPIEVFLLKELGLRLNEKKSQIYDVRRGIEFLGVYIKPFRTYTSTRCWKRMRRKICKEAATLTDKNCEHFRSSISSYLGVLSHTNSFYKKSVEFYKLRIDKYI